MNRCLAIALLACPIAVAADADRETARACAAITEDRARLVCYDAAFSGKSAGLVAVEKADPTRMTARFGDQGQLPTQRAIKAEIPRRVNFKLKAVESLVRGKFRLTMDDGQVWVTKESDLGLDFAIGDEVTIQQMIGGGFRVSHAHQGRDVGITRIL